MMITPGSTVIDAAGHKLAVGQFLGQGGFGAVFKVDTTDGRHPLALKTLTIPFSAGSEDFRVFLNEGNHALKIRHKNVIRYDFFHDGSQYKHLPPYILMEYANGGTLAELIDRAKQDNNPFSPETLLDMFSQLIEGMTAVNDVLVHRDIKPENILLSGNTLKISDFGLAKLAQEATRKNTFKGFGTFPYMAPEAWRGDKNTILLDIYAMGMVFYELATLKHPFSLQTNDLQQWKDAHLLQNVEPPHKSNKAIPLGVSQMILKMVEKSSATRAKDWSEVKKLMDVVTKSESARNPLIAGMMKKRIEADAVIEGARLTKQKEQQSEQEFGTIVVSQARNAIIGPLQEFFEEFNSQYAGRAIATVLNESGVSLALSIVLPDGTAGKVEFKALIESQFWRDQQFSDFGRTITRRVLAVPTLNKRKVQGFGLVQLEDGRGFNIALLEKAGEIYGDWFILINKDNALSTRRPRPSPFPFSYKEMEQELQYVGVMHIYTTELRLLDMSFIEEFFADAIA